MNRRLVSRAVLCLTVILITGSAIFALLVTPH